MNNPFNVESFNSEYFGYKQISTFYEDFGIAEFYGKDSIIETYNNILWYWSDSYKYLTEFVMVLNWKCWSWYDKGNKDLCSLYEELFYKAQEYAFKNLKGEELSYFIRTTD